MKSKNWALLICWINAVTMASISMACYALNAYNVANILIIFGTIWFLLPVFSFEYIKRKYGKGYLDKEM